MTAWCGVGSGFQRLFRPLFLGRSFSWFSLPCTCLFCGVSFVVCCLASLLSCMHASFLLFLSPYPLRGRGVGGSSKVVKPCPVSSVRWVGAHSPSAATCPSEALCHQGRGFSSVTKNKALEPRVVLMLTLRADAPITSPEPRLEYG